LEAETKRSTRNTNRYAIRHTIGEYALNVKMVLAMQQMGCAQAAGAVLGGMLSVGHNCFKNIWPKLEEKIGAMQVILGNTILEENLRKEK
jgi:hypothetical protein